MLQKDLDTVLEWANKWKRELNVDKCKKMHLYTDSNAENPIQRDSYTTHTPILLWSVGVSVYREGVSVCSVV